LNTALRRKRLDGAVTNLDRIIVAISGSSAPHYGVRLLEVLSGFEAIETHAIVSAGARKTIAYEMERDPETVEQLADVVHDERDVGASIASGTFITSGMVIAPCSIKTLSAVANSTCDNLIARAADVCLKERRRLVLVTRETPLHAGHLRLMLQATEAGAVVLPPVPAFYHRPTRLEDIIDHTVTKILDQFGIDGGLISRWQGLDAPQ
jgi:polyprenyl P-hydroxybenzoate/phenylacrylic acid decarboxylase-like protein